MTTFVPFVVTFFLVFVHRTSEQQYPNNRFPNPGNTGYQDQYNRYQENRNQDSRYQDTRYQDNRFQDNRNQDSRFQDTRSQSSRFPDQFSGSSSRSPNENTQYNRENRFDRINNQNNQFQTPTGRPYEYDRRPDLFPNQNPSYFQPPISTTTSTPFPALFSPPDRVSNPVLSNPVPSNPVPSNPVPSIPVYGQVPVARLCVISEKELEKCNRMRNAFRAQRLKPELSCVTAHDTIGCMEDIREGRADLTMLDAGDMYRAGVRYNLMPILMERYNLRESAYYVVAVARQSDRETDLLYLKGKKSCHTGFGEAAGWIIPMSFMVANERMRSYGPCESARSAAQFFQKSCIPGALSNRFQSTSAWDLTNLCDLCHGQSYDYCSRDSTEPFYGATGALRCLIDGGGSIAFTRHTAILENAAGRNPSFWSRNLIPDDFELVCRDGSRASYKEYQKCNLGKVPGNAIVTHSLRPREDVDAFVNLFLTAQQFFGSKYSDEYTFKMFVSEPTFPDLIFSDGTSQLLPVPEVRRHYKFYLGPEFLKSLSLVDCSASHLLQPSIMSLLVPSFLFFMGFMVNLIKLS